MDGDDAIPCPRRPEVPADPAVPGPALFREDGARPAERPAAVETLSVGPVEIPYLGRDEVLRALDRAFAGGRPVRLAFCNANTMLKALTSPAYAAVLRQFLVLNDGVGIDLCSRLFNGRAFAENLNGTDFTPEVLRRSAAGLRIFLLGAAPGTAEAAAVRLAADYPRHVVVGTRDGFFGAEETGAVVADIDRAAPDLLLVGMGNPRQEEFIAAVAPRLRVPVVMAVGAFLDFAAGNVVRAPAIVQALRAEWLFRLLQEPRRLGRRYTVDLLVFLAMIVKLRLAIRSAPHQPRFDRGAAR